MPEQQQSATAIIDIVVSTGTGTGALQQQSRVKCRRVVAMRSWVEAGIQLSEFPHVRRVSAKGRKLAQNRGEKEQRQKRTGRGGGGREGEIGRDEVMARSVSRQRGRGGRRRARGE